MFRMFQMGGPKGNAFGVMFIINIALWGVAAFGCWVVIGLAVAAYRYGAIGGGVALRVLVLKSSAWGREGGRVSCSSSTLSCGVGLLSVAGWRLR